jgi:ABC-type multidrug transport system fused ATPase/permease subunit
VAALLRLTPICEGTIRIDGVDISAISLRDLRKRLAVIPQEPVIFSGSIRTNLDPFNELTNDEITGVLQQVQLNDRIAELDAPLGELSHGERNLLAVSRALLRHAKVQRSGLAVVILINAPPQ